MNHRKEINVKLLALGLFATLLFSFLWVIFSRRYFCPNHSLTLIEDMYLYAILGYIEVAIGYIVLMLLLHITKLLVKRKFTLYIRAILLIVIWLSVFSCMEVWVPFLFTNKYVHEYDCILYLPPFFIKALFFIYYIYKKKCVSYKK